MKELTHKFFEAYLNAFPNETVYTDDVPQEMISTEVNQDGWFQWKLIKGTLIEDEYKKIEDEFKIKLPKSFIQWHQEFFFLDCDTSIARLPISNPNLPLKSIKENLDWFVAGELISQQLYPFGDEGNDAGPLVFDGRNNVIDNNFPIRVYDHEFEGELDGLSEIIFSSFEKLIECLTHFMKELKTRRNFEIIPDFFKIDPLGAGLTGVQYWSSWVNMQKGNFEKFGY
ncbi:hypothetical protein [Emticicia oligotrophica]|uniref:hypothetical protein n=1 Tax=Emticicia oligotrophica TaxID=312279 RepID=UPI00273AA7B1|nr:hypothetical protein [Emticicia oligotrophica]